MQKKLTKKQVWDYLFSNEDHFDVTINEKSGWTATIFIKFFFWINVFDSIIILHCFYNEKESFKSILWFPYEQERDNLRYRELLSLWALDYDLGWFQVFYFFFNIKLAGIKSLESAYINENKYVHIFEYCDFLLSQNLRIKYLTDLFKDVNIYKILKIW